MTRYGVRSHLQHFGMKHGGCGLSSASESSHNQGLGEQVVESEEGGQFGIRPVQRPLVEVFRVSVDESTNDNGFLSCCYWQYHGVVNSAVYPHGDSASAFSNIRGGRHDDEYTITGHGNQGIILTGDGQVASDPNKYMDVNNEAYWRRHAQGGIEGSRLTLFGCKVGGGTAGANFLYRVAQAVGKEVGAWTGDVWCGGGRNWPWGTGTFVTATLAAPPEPVDSPEMFDVTTAMNILKIRSGVGFENLPLSTVKSLKFTPLGIYSDVCRPVTVDDADAPRISGMIDFGRPFITEAKPGALIVGQLVLTYENRHGEECSRTFHVLGYTLLQDTVYPGVYYYASSGLQKELESKR